MKRFHALSTALLFAFASAACGGSEPAEEGEMEAGAEATAAEAGADTAARQQAAGELAIPEWYTVDHDAQTVTLEITAGSTSENNYWNFNGFFGGAGRIVVPQGYSVTVNLTNSDPNMAHSAGIDSRTGNFPPNFTSPEPAFEGAITPDPTSMTEGTMPGQSDSFTFTASEAGEYTLLCYIPGHAVTGMYVPFTISADGEAGVQGA